MKYTKHTIFRNALKKLILSSTPSTPIYEMRQARKHTKFIKHASTPSTQAHQVCKAIQAREHASTLFSRLEIIFLFYESCFLWHVMN